MDDQDQLLILFSWLFIVVMLLCVMIPFLRGRSDLITGFNLFLVGSANFVGASALGSAYTGSHYRDYHPDDYMWFMLGVVTFFFTVVFSYHFFKFPRRLGGRVLRKWPPVTVPVLFFMVPCSFMLTLVPAFVVRLQFFSQLFGQIGNKAIAFCVVLAFVAWYRQKANPALITILVGTVSVGLVLAVMAGGGRRTMVAVIISIPVCVYWLTMRYRSTGLNLAVVGLFAFMVTMAIAAYSEVRHFDRKGPVRESRNVSNAVTTLKRMTEAVLNPDLENITKLLGQNAAECSILSIHLYTREMDPEPFHSLLYVLVNPVPRVFWPEKPKGLGKTLPKDYGLKNSRATWGPGIVGHGFHEGGLHMLVFYGFLVASALRLLDELPMRQAGNPYILGAFTAATGHIIGWPRGDIGTFTINLISSVLMMLLAGGVGRLFFGTGLIYPRTDRFEVTRQGFFPARR